MATMIDAAPVSITTEVNHVSKAALERLVGESARRLQVRLSAQLLRSCKGAVPAAHPRAAVPSIDYADRVSTLSTIAGSRAFQQATVRTLVEAMPDTLGDEWIFGRGRPSHDEATGSGSQSVLRSAISFLISSAGALALGSAVGVAMPEVGRIIVSIFDLLMDAYTWISPLVIFTVVAPAFARIFGSRRGHRWGWITIKGFLGIKLLACVFGVVATTVLFRLPWRPASGSLEAASLVSPLQEASWNLIANPFYWGIYLSVVCGLLACRYIRLAQILDGGVRAIERFGEMIEPFIPVFLFTAGIYIVSLPDAIASEAGAGVTSLLRPFQVLGISLDLSTPFGMIGLYVYGSVLVALACWIWHGLLLVATVFAEPRFRIKNYFTRYWSTVYPLLWSTSSERLAQPVSLHRAKVFAPWVSKELRRLAIGLGTSMNINGTIICVFVLGGMVAQAVGVEIGLFHLLVAMPLVYLISLAVPGIPGELVLFAGPLIAAFGMDPELASRFLALYVGLQLGLPDSFRTGTNSTDDMLCTVAFNALGERAQARSTALDDVGGGGQVPKAA